jgi:hypothetical protein
MSALSRRSLVASAATLPALAVPAVAAPRAAKGVVPQGDSIEHSTGRTSRTGDGGPSQWLWKQQKPNAHLPNTEQEKRRKKSLRRIQRCVLRN